MKGFHTTTLSLGFRAVFVKGEGLSGMLQAFYGVL